MARRGMGRVLYLLDDFTGAKAWFTKLSQESPQDPDYLGMLGLIAMKLGDRVEAMRCLKLLEQIDNKYDHGRTLYAQAKVLAALGEQEEAIDKLKRSMLKGVGYTDGLHTDWAWEPLRNHPRFQALLKPRG